MKCPQCHKESRCYETRQHTDFTLRRRECLDCKTRFATTEVFAGLIGQRKQPKKIISKPKPKEKRSVPAVHTKVSKPVNKPPLVKDDLDMFYRGERVDLSDLGLDVGRGWRDDEY